MLKPSVYPEFKHITGVEEVWIHATLGDRPALIANAVETMLEGDRGKRLTVTSVSFSSWVVFSEPNVLPPTAEPVAQLLMTVRGPRNDLEDTFAMVQSGRLFGQRNPEWIRALHEKQIRMMHEKFVIPVHIHTMDRRKIALAVSSLVGEMDCSFTSVHAYQEPRPTGNRIVWDSMVACPDAEAAHALRKAFCKMRAVEKFEYLYVGEPILLAAAG